MDVKLIRELARAYTRMGFTAEDFIDHLRQLGMSPEEIRRFLLGVVRDGVNSDG